MSAWEYERLAAEAQGGRIGPAYLLAGPDAFQKRAVLAAIRAGLEAGGHSVHAVYLDGQRVTPEEMVAEARAVDLLGRRLIVVDDPPWIASHHGNSTTEADADV